MVEIVAQPDGEQQESAYTVIFGLTDRDLQRLMYQLCLFLALDDIDVVLAVMACAVSVVDENGEPLWLLLIGPSSGGKTEPIKMMSGLADKQESYITLAGLLAQRMGRKGLLRPKTGLLADIGDDCNALCTISDLSSLLGGGSKLSGAQQTGVFDALRDIYDGQYKRSMNEVNPEWNGRLTFIAACTPAIDQMHSFVNTLGPRWVNFRLEQRDGDQRDQVADMVITRKNLSENRAEVANQITQLVEAARGRLGDVIANDAMIDLVKECADLGTYGRATVPRDYQGRIDGEPHWEEPGRLTLQLMKLARGLIALNVDDAVVRRIVRRAALSCLPTERLNVLRQLVPLTTEEWLSTNTVAQRAKQHHRVATRALEDWAQVGIVEGRLDPKCPMPTGYETDTRTKQWRLAEDHRERVVKLVPKPEEEPFPDVDKTNI